MGDFLTLLSVLSKDFVNNILIFFLTLAFALPLGLLISLGRMSRFKILVWPIKFYLWVIRGTPLMLQLIVVYLFIGRYLPINRFSAAVVAFALNYAAYFAEIYRGGIESIPRGQYEAANVLGFTRAQTFMRIILPQVVKRILPPMSNEFITLVKDTSLANFIAVVEILNTSKEMLSANGAFGPVFVAGGFFLLMNGIVSQAFALAERRLSYYKL